VTGERIRDKIAASKKKGIWVGGVVPLGYALHDRKLVIEMAEAATVRLVFERYLALGSLSLLQRDLRDRNIVTRARPMASGGTRGGVPLTNGPLNHMLRNRIYLGEINHRESSYPGEHAPIIDRDLFEKVQTRLNENRTARGMRRTRSEALLLGRIYDDRGNRMSPSYAIKKGTRYRYYISCVVQQGRKEEAGSVPRVAAQDVEGIVMNTLAALPPSEQDADQASECERVERLVERITVSHHAIEILLVKPNVATTNPLVVPWSPQTFRRKREVIQPTDSPGGRPIRAESRIRLLNGIAKARHWLGEILAGSVPDIETISQRENMSARAARMTLSLAFIAPDIVEAVAKGTLPRGFGLSRLTDLPISWAKQRQKLGLPARS
jgi:hypothetical protein